jgi:hypothetical protein
MTIRDEYEKRMNELGKEYDTTNMTTDEWVKRENEIERELGITRKRTLIDKKRNIWKSELVYPESNKEEK